MFFEEYLEDWENREDADGEKLYEDYYVMNKNIIDKYNVPIIEEVKEYMDYHEGEKLNYINKDTLYEFIEQISSIDLKEYEQRAKRTL